LTPRRVSTAGVLLVLAATVAALLIVALTGRGGEDTPNAVVSGAAIPIQSARAFDPGGDPPNEEHNDEAELAVDSDPSTGWTTEIYSASPVMSEAANKPGVGLVVITKKAVTARTMTIKTADGGWDARIYASTTPPSVDAEGEPVGTEIGSVSDANAEQTIQLNATKARYFLIWVTKVSPTFTDTGYSLEIDEVTLNS
jgi:hypothetical protein